MEEDRQTDAVNLEEPTGELRPAGAEVPQEPQEPQRVDTGSTDIADFVAHYLQTLEAGLRQVAEEGVNQNVSEVVELFLKRVTAQDEQTAIHLSTALGLGVMLATATLHQDILNRADLLQKVGWHYTAACLNSLWPSQELSQKPQA